MRHIFCFCNLMLLFTSFYHVQVHGSDESFTAVLGDSFQLPCEINYPNSRPRDWSIVKRHRTVCGSNSSNCAASHYVSNYTCGVQNCGERNFVFFLNIPAVSLKDDDEYFCIHGSGSRRARINVNYPPSITSRFPRTFTVPELTRVNIDCSTYTTPGQPQATSYVWRHPTGFTTPVLDINSIDRSQAGQYTCTASNNLLPGRQGVVSSTVVVDVQYKPSFSGLQTPYDVIETTNLRLNCSIFTDSNPTVDYYSWSGPEGHINNDSVLSINKIGKDKAGLYKCTATNSIGTGIGQFRINVQYRPSISINPDPYRVTENTNLALNCSEYTQSNPAVDSYRWSGPGGFNSNGPLLSINNINRIESGLYECAATNSIGTDTGKFMINVQTHGSTQQAIVSISTGSIVASIVGFLVLVIIISAAVIIYRKGCRFTCAFPKDEIKGNVQQLGEDNRAYITTGRTPQEQATYEELKDKSVVEYEALKQHERENTPQEANDPPYVDATSA